MLLSFSGSKINCTVFLSVQGFGWVSDWISQVVKMMGQWEVWGTSAAHQNMASLLLHLVFKGECGPFKLAYISLKTNLTFCFLPLVCHINKHRFVNKVSLIFFKEFDSMSWKPWGYISWPSSIRVIAQINSLVSFDYLIWFCPLQAVLCMNVQKSAVHWMCSCFRCAVNWATLAGVIVSLQHLSHSSHQVFLLFVFISPELLGMIVRVGMSKRNIKHSLKKNGIYGAWEVTLMCLLLLKHMRVLYFARPFMNHVFHKLHALFNKTRVQFIKWVHDRENSLSFHKLRDLASDWKFTSACVMFGSMNIAWLSGWARVNMKVTFIVKPKMIWNISLLELYLVH